MPCSNTQVSANTENTVNTENTKNTENTQLLQSLKFLNTKDTTWKCPPHADLDMEEGTEGGLLAS